MWPHISEYCRIRRVQKSVTVTLRCLVLSLSQWMTHTLVSRSINEDVKQMPAGWQRFVGWVWISTWPVSSLGSSVHCGYRRWFFHCAVLLKEPFMAVSVRKSMWISFTTCPFLWSLAYFPLDWIGWKCCWFCVAVQHTTISKCFHQNELVEDTAHSGSCSAYFWKRFPSCFIPLIVVQIWHLKSWRDICKMVSS